MTFPATFQGYRRATGRPGIRNKLLILSTCGLNAAQAAKVAAALPEAALLSNLYGRGQVGADKRFGDGVMRSLATHPNIGAVLVLAPDAGQRATFQEHTEQSGRLAAGLSLEECGEDGPHMVAEAIKAGRGMIRALAGAERSRCPVSDLAIAVECGHSDAYSGLIANPLAGRLSDALVAAGGAVVFSETLEWLGTEHMLAARCRDDAQAARLMELVAARHEVARAVGKDLRIGNPGPQNHAGGITTLEEKSLGAVTKGGSSPVVAVLAEGEALTGPGLHLMDTPTLSPESITSMVAGGAQLVVFTTGHGNPYGSAVAPTLKLTANPETAARLPEQIDYDASGAVAGDDPLPGLIACAAAIAEGRLTAAERAGEGFEVISRLGPSV